MENRVLSRDVKMKENSSFCIHSILKDYPQPEIRSVSSFHFGAALESVYPLLDIIFSFLSDADLKTICEVKTSWKAIADRELKKRNKPSWISCSKKLKINVVQHSENIHYNNANIGIILYNYRRLSPNKYMCLHKDTSCLQRMTIIEYIAKEIACGNENYCLLSCPKVVSYLSSDTYSPSGSIFDGIFVPEIPGIRTTMFYCNPIKLKKDNKVINDYIKPNEEIKCLLLFALNDLHRSIENLFNALGLLSKPQEVAVGGGIIRGTKTFNQNTQRIISTNDTFCIAFVKDKNSDANFNSSSLVLNGNNFSNEEFEAELMKFKEKILIRNNSVGFRICCGAKWGKEDESVIFNKIFPNIPLLGLEADGEIGWNCFNLKNDEENIESKRKKSKKPYPKLQHEWSTVFVIITWGELIKKH